jgi:glycosyltransferase involved in cell wall biosynthesis
MVRVSVVIPTFSRSSTISKAVEKILENTVQPDEIIVVDQSPDNLTFEVLSKFIETGTVTYIKEAFPSLSKARNIGWRKATGDVIAFTDDDAMVALNWIETIKRSFEQKDLNIGVLGGKVVPLYEEKNPDWAFPKRWEYFLPVYDQGNSLENFREGAFPAGVNYSIYRSLLEKFNGFDESIGPQSGRKVQIPCEDAELALRLKQSGFNLVYNPGCVVHHPVSLSRQNPDFLNKRVLEDGACSAYFQIKTNPNTMILLWSLFKCIVKYSYFGLSKLAGSKNNEDLYYLYGRILVLFKYGLLKQDFGSL